MSWHRARDALHLLPNVPRHGHRIGPGNSKTLPHHGAHQDFYALALHEAAVGQPCDCGQRVVGAIENQLGPKRAFHVVGDLHRHSGIGKHLREFLAECRWPDNELSSTVVPDMAWTRHFGGNVDDGRGDGAREQRL